LSFSFNILYNYNKEFLSKSIFKPFMELDVSKTHIKSIDSRYSSFSAICSLVLIETIPRIF